MSDHYPAVNYFQPDFIEEDLIHDDSFSRNKIWKYKQMEHITGYQIEIYFIKRDTLMMLLVSGM
jgi:hypothetical protein